MSWVGFSLLTALIFSFSVLLDKYIVGRLGKQFWGLPVASAVIGFLFGCIFFLTSDRIFPPVADSLIILLTGMFTVWGAVFYFKALTEETSSIVVILFQLQPIFVLALSWSILGETISVIQTAGFLVILGCALLLSIQKDSESRSARTYRLSTAFWWVIGADLFWALGSVLFKLVVSESNIWIGAALESWGIFVGGGAAAMFVPAIRNQFIEIVRSNRPALPFVAFNETLFTTGKLLLLYAILLGPVALVTVLGSTTVVFTMGAEALLSLVLPKIYPRQPPTFSPATRIFLALLMLAGVGLLQLS